VGTDGWILALHFWERPGGSGVPPTIVLAWAVLQLGHDALGNQLTSHLGPLTSAQHALSADFKKVGRWQLVEFKPHN
jgi:hypothetical protein